MKREALFILKKRIDKPKTELKCRENINLPFFNVRRFGFVLNIDNFVMKNVWLRKCRFKKIYGYGNIGCEIFEEKKNQKKSSFCLLKSW